MTNPVLQKPAAEKDTLEGELLTKAQAANILGIKPRTLDDWRAAKAIPVVVRGRWVRLLRADVADFLNRHRVAAKPAPAYRPRRRRANAATAA